MEGACDRMPESMRKKPGEPYPRSPDWVAKYHATGAASAFSRRIPRSNAVTVIPPYYRQSGRQTDSFTGRNREEAIHADAAGRWTKWPSANLDDDFHCSAIATTLLLPRPKL